MFCVYVLVKEKKALCFSRLFYKYSKDWLHLLSEESHKIINGCVGVQCLTRIFKLGTLEEGNYFVPKPSIMLLFSSAQLDK